MAGDVETFLIKKLSRDIEDTKSREHYLSPFFMFHLDKYFQKSTDLLKNLPIHPNAGASGPASDETERRKTLYLLNNLLSEWQLISKKSVFEGIVGARRLGQELKKIKRDLQGGDSSISLGARSTGEQEVQPENFDTYRWSSRTVDPSRVHGLDDKVRFLERLLLRKESKDGFKAIAIVGMLGVGKTTLCQLMFNNSKLMDEFLPRIWVCQSKQPEDDRDNRKEIVKRMLMCLGVEDEIIESVGQDPNLGLQKLMFALRLQLMGKKYLIVLDDAWNSDKCFENLTSLSTEGDSCYEQLAYGLPKGHGGTVIVTCRSEEIAKKMVGEENLHHLPPLKDGESCWKIFMDSISAEKDEERFQKNLNNSRVGS